MGQAKNNYTTACIEHLHSRTDIIIITFLHQYLLLNHPRNEFDRVENSIEINRVWFSENMLSFIFPHE